jgi:hypothetical protein
VLLAVAAIRFDLNLQSRLGFGGLMAAILLVGAPIIVMGERQRYLELGEQATRSNKSLERTPEG